MPLVGKDTGPTTSILLSLNVAQLTCIHVYVYVCVCVCVCVCVYTSMTSSLSVWDEDLSPSAIGRTNRQLDVIKLAGESNCERASTRPNIVNAALSKWLTTQTLYVDVRTNSLLLSCCNIHRLATRSRLTRSSEQAVGGCTSSTNTYRAQTNCDRSS